MKRQARPFVVEVKKRRGGLPGKRPLWAGFDLTVVANEEAPSAHDADTLEDISVGSVIGPGALYSVAGHTGSKEDPEAAEINDQSAGTVQSEIGDDVEPISVEAQADTPERMRRRSQRHREAVASLPRGQRWKRRLPAVLLRRTKRGACACV